MKLLISPISNMIIIVTNHLDAKTYQKVETVDMTQGTWRRHHAQ